MPSKPARAAAAAARALSMAAAYLGPLLWAAALYLCRLAIDVIAGIRVAMLRRGARREPARREACGARETEIRQAAAARWAAWDTLPRTRRAAVRAAAVATVFAVALALRPLWPAAAEPGPTSDHAQMSSAPQDPLTSQPTPSAPPIDMDRAAATFLADSRRAASGQWVFMTGGAALEPGAPGAWDDFSVASPAILRDSPSEGGGYRMWYRGCSPRARDRGCAIGHAASADGLRWTKTAGPVFQPVDAARRPLHALAVARTQAGYLMWYSWTPALFGSQKASSLHLATSQDGLRWDAAGEVLIGSEHLPYPIEPFVLHEHGRLHLWYVDSLRHFERDDFGETAGAPLLMHFTSADGRLWKEAGTFPLGGHGIGRVRLTVDRNPDGAYRGTFFERGEERWGHLVSTDGHNWDLSPSGPTRMAAPAAAFGGGGASVTDATGLQHEGGALVWFVAHHRGGREDIRVGFRKDD